MGTKKQWTGREKLALVLEGLKGDAGSANCAMSMVSRRGCTTNVSAQPHGEGIKGRFFRREIAKR